MRHSAPIIEFKAGLRQLENLRADIVHLVEASNVYADQAALHTYELPTKLDVGSVLQISTLRNYIYVVTTTGIYEYKNGSLTQVHSVESSDTWGIADFGEFIFFISQSKVIVRDPFTGVFSEVSDIPKGFDAVNYNGQCLVIGTPSV